jgi:hypothetical protein
MDSLRKTKSRIMVCGQFIYPVNDDCQLILRGEQVEHEPLPEQAAMRVSHSLEDISGVARLPAHRGAQPGRGFANGHHQNEWFNPAAFSVPTAYNWGNSGRNILRGPDEIDVDSSAGKKFPITEGTNLLFRLRGV